MLEKYFDKKYVKFAKNVAISIPFMWAGGIAGAGLADIVTDSEGYITAASMAGEFIGAIGSFLPLHYRDNKNNYLDDLTEKFKPKAFSWDLAKIVFTFGIADTIYMIARPAINYYLLKEGNDPVSASNLSFWIAYPTHHILKIPIAKLTGIFNEDKEDNTH